MSIYTDMSVWLKHLPWFEDQVIYEDGLPDGPDDAVGFSVFGGYFERIHSVTHPAWTVYGVEFRVRSDKPDVCLDRCEAIMNKFDGVTNFSINGTVYREIFITSPPKVVARDPGGQVTYSVGFTVTRRGMV